MGRIVCVDYGKVRSGIAISDETKTLSRALKVVIGLENLKKEIKNIQDTYEIDEIVIGLSKHPDGTVSEIGKLAENFSIFIKKNFNIKTVLYDESMTTKEVEKRFREIGRSLKKYKNVIDKYAAEFILEEYLK